MPKNPKIYFPGSLHLVTTRVEEGIMFPPNALINEIIHKCIAQACSLYPVRIHHICVSTTHVHILFTCIDPSDAADFMERFKAESAIALNKLLGREKRTIWCSGYDSPLINHLESAMHWIAYIYENPAKDGLTDSINSYPGVNSYKLFKKATHSGLDNARIRTYYLPRNSFEKLPDKPLKEHDYVRLRRKAIYKRKKNYFQLDFNSWMEALGITDKQQQQEINLQILKEVQKREAAHARDRALLKRPAMSRKRLVLTPIGEHHVPKNEGQRTLTVCIEKQHRKKTLSWLQALINEGKRVLALWRMGDFSTPYPMGLFPPTNIRLVEPIGW